MKKINNIIINRLTKEKYKKYNKIYNAFNKEQI